MLASTGGEYSPRSGLVNTVSPLTGVEPGAGSHPAGWRKRPPTVSRACVYAQGATYLLSEAPMVASYAMLAIISLIIYSLTKLAALMITLRGTKPTERAQLIRALGDLFPGRQSRAPWRSKRACRRAA